MTAKTQPEACPTCGKENCEHEPPRSREARMCAHFAQEIETIVLHEPRSGRLDKIITVLLACGAQLKRLAAEPVPAVPQGAEPDERFIAYLEALGKSYP